MLNKFEEQVRAADLEAKPRETDQIFQDPIQSDESLDYLAANEDGDAALFNKLHDGRFIFDHSAGAWHCWQGHYWREDVTGQAMRGIDKVIDAYATESKRQAWAAATAEKSGKTDESKTHTRAQDALLKRIRALQSAQRKKNVLFLTSVGRGLHGDE